MTNDEWLRPKALLALIKEHRIEWCGNEDKYLRPALVEGLVKVRAKRARLNHGVNRATEFCSDWRVRRSVWVRKYGESTLDLSADTFSTTEPGTGYLSVELTGLSFSKAELLDFADINSAAILENETNRGKKHHDTESSGRSLGENGHPVDRGGAPTDANKWSNLVAVVGAVLGNADFVNNDPPKRSALRKIIVDYADKVGLPIGSKGTIDPAIDLLIKVAWAAHDGEQPLMAADGQSLKSDSNLQR